MPEDKDKKMEYLQRAEIKTMQKDVAALREVEAARERERVSKINAAEEKQKQKEKEEMTQKAADQRTSEQLRAQKREEEMKRLKEERIKREAETAKQEVENQEIRTGDFKDALKDVQAKEEEERKRFLQRVETKAEGLSADEQDKEEPSSPLPPPPPPPPLSEKPKKSTPLTILKKIPRPVFKTPSFGQKLWIRIVLTLLAIAILAAVATFWYWYLVVREREVSPPLTEEEKRVQQELIIPAALISTEASQTLDVSLLGQFLTEDMVLNKFTRLILKKPEKNEVLGLKEFFEAFEVKTPLTFYEKVDNNFTLFVYASQSGNRLGLIAQVKEPDLFYLLKAWETTMENDFENLSVFLGKTGPSSTPSFKQVSYKDVDFRYLSFAPENFGLCWTMTDQYFILTFSGESIIKTIDKIK